MRAVRAVIDFGERGSFALAKGPAFGSAEFYGKWLLAAVQAENFWKELQTAPDFEEEYEPICFARILDFGKAASLMIMKLRECNSFLINQEDFEGWDFTMMLEMGFFKKCREYYRMVIPTELTKERVQEAVLALVKTDDEECMLHPEYFIDTMPLARARATQEWLSMLMDADAYASVGRC